MEKFFEDNPFEFRQFIVEKKNGTKIGGAQYFNVLAPYGKPVEMGYALLPKRKEKPPRTTLPIAFFFVTADL